MRTGLVEQAVGVVMRENACDAQTATSSLCRSAADHHIPLEDVATMVLTIQRGDYAQAAASARVIRPLE